MTPRERAESFIWTEAIDPPRYPDRGRPGVTHSDYCEDTQVCIKLIGDDGLVAWRGPKEDAEGICEDLRDMVEVHVLAAMREARREAAEKIGPASYEKLLETVIALREICVPYEKTHGNRNEIRWNRMIQDIDEALTAVGMDPKRFDIGVDIEGERV